MNALTDRKLLYTIKTVPFAIIVIFVSLLFAIVVTDSNKRAIQLEKNLVSSNLVRQKESIAQRVESIYSQVRYDRGQTVATLKSQVKHQVDIAYQVAMAIYKQNSGQPEQDVKRMIADALRNIRYNDGRGYFFIYQSDGLSVMHTTQPHQEGKQAIDMRDSRGVPFLKHFLASIAKSDTNDAFYRWWFSKPQHEGEHEKIGYGRQFEPFDWIIGSGEYVDDVESQVKKDILHWISNHRFGDNGYLFVLNMQGEVLAHRDDMFVGSTLTKLATVTRKKFEMSNTNSGYIEYQSTYQPNRLSNFEKVSYMKLDYEWGWLIGSGVYMEDIQKNIAVQLSQMREQHEVEQVKVMMLCLTLALLLTFFSILLSNYLGRRFNQFQGRIEKDFEELEKGKELLRHQAQHDALTHLPNRVLLEEDVQLGIATSRLKDKMLAILFVDLDNFKRVNDKYGHQVGDELLVQAAKRFTHLVADEGTVARFGGDEFVFCLPFIRDQAHANTFAKKIQSTLIHPFLIQGISLELNSSIGVSLFPNDGDQPRDLMSKADIVLTRSKKQGKGYITFFDPKISQELHSKFLLEDEFKSALKRKEFEVYYQPQVNSQTGDILGVEALCRWFSPTLGFVSPLVFIDIAEKNNAIIELGAFVLDKACRDAKKLNEHADRPISVSINVSPKQLLHHGFIDLVVSTCERYQLSNHLIVLELTENVFIEDLKAVQPTLLDLQNRGFGISLDDFGTGFSSLSYLNTLPITEIKIDRSFIINMLADQSNLNIVKTIIAIAHSNDLNIIAEGVEDVAQQRMLQTLGCMTIQGYLYSKPVAFSDILNKVDSPLCCS